MTNSSASATPPGGRRTRGPALPAVVVLALAALAAGGAPAFGAAPPAGADREVRAVLEEQAKAWNAGKLERFMDTYWDSDELTFFSGDVVNRGRKAVLERYRKRYQARGQEMGRLTFSELEVSVLSADRALARGRWRVVKSKETLGGLFTLVLRKFPEGWKIVHDHTSAAEPPKPRP